MSLFKRKKEERIDTGRAVNWGIAAGVGEALYVLLATLFINFVDSFGKEPLGGFVTSFLAFLMFFVLSSVISAVLVFGRPLYFILDKKYKEAVASLMATIITMLVITLLVFVVILLFQTK